MDSMLSLIKVADVALMSKLRHIHILCVSFAFSVRTVLHLSGELAQFFDLKLVYLELLLFFTDYQQLPLFFCSLSHEL